MSSNNNNSQDKSNCKSVNENEDDISEVEED